MRGGPTFTYRHADRIDRAASDARSFDATTDLTDQCLAGAYGQARHDGCTRQRRAQGVASVAIGRVHIRPYWPLTHMTWRGWHVGSWVHSGHEERPSCRAPQGGVSTSAPAGVRPRRADRDCD